MILKVKAADRWWIFDDIRKLSHGYRSIDIDANGNLREELRADISLLTSLDEIIPTLCPEFGPIIHEYVHVIFRREDQSTEKSMFFDEVMYICNDDGKTIEKITPREAE